MEKEVIVVGNDALLNSAKRLYQRKEITIQQYAQMLRRSSDIEKQKSIRRIKQYSGRMSSKETCEYLGIPFLLAP